MTRAPTKSVTVRLPAYLVDWIDRKIEGTKADRTDAIRSFVEVFYDGRVDVEPRPNPFPADDVIAIFLSKEKS